MNANVQSTYGGGVISQWGASAEVALYLQSSATRNFSQKLFRIVYLGVNDV